MFRAIRFQTSGVLSAAGAEDGFEGVADRTMRWLPYPLLAASLLITLLQSAVGSTEVSLAVVIPTTVTAAIWTVLLLGRGYEVGTHQRRLAVYFVGRLILAAVLIIAAPWYGIYSWFAFVECIRYFRQPACFLAAVGAAAVTSVSYVGGAPHTAAGWGMYAVVAAGVTLIVSFFAITSQRTWARDSDRIETLAQLRVANQRLATALDDNQALQDQLLAQARAAGVLDERSRLAGEIHDTLAQALTGILTQLEAAERSGELARRDGHVDRARALARSGLAEARRSLHALRPTPLDGSRLGDALAETAARWAKTANVAVDVEVTGDVIGLDTDAEIALLRVAQEGLANVERHARASKVHVTLTYLDDVVLLDVRDDGSGFVPADARPGPDGTTVGLATMRERLHRVGGELEIESEPAAGTALVARVPAR